MHPAGPSGRARRRGDPGDAGSRAPTRQEAHRRRRRFGAQLRDVHPCRIGAAQRARSATGPAARRGTRHPLSRRPRSGRAAARRPHRAPVHPPSGATAPWHDERLRPRHRARAAVRPLCRPRPRRDHRRGGDPPFRAGRDRPHLGLLGRCRGAPARRGGRRRPARRAGARAAPTRRRRPTGRRRRPHRDVRRPPDQPHRGTATARSRVHEHAPERGRRNDVRPEPARRRPRCARGKPRRLRGERAECSRTAGQLRPSPGSPHG